MVDDPWQVDSQGVRVTRMPTSPIRLLRLRGYDDAVLDALDRSLSVALPRAPNHAAGADPRVIGLAPGEWMIVGGAISDDLLLSAAAGAIIAHVANVGEGRVAYAVAGPRARDLIAKGCPIDLHPRAFAAGRSAQSVLAQVFVVIDQPSNDAVFHLYAEASYARYLELWFADAVLEFRTEDTA